jgi:hypothetical protein
LRMEYLLLCPPIGRPLGTVTILVVYSEASVIGDMLRAALVPSSRWDGSLESPLPVSSSSNSKSDPTKDGKEKFCPAPDSATLDVPPDTLRTSTLLHSITKPTHWPNRSPTISPVYRIHQELVQLELPPQTDTTSLHSAPSRT